MFKQSTTEFLKAFHDMHKDTKNCLDCAVLAVGGYVMPYESINNLRRSFEKLGRLLSGGGSPGHPSPDPTSAKNKSKSYHPC